MGVMNLLLPFYKPQLLTWVNYNTNYATSLWYSKNKRKKRRRWN